jgi:sec-independent protein translocase protein TatA
VLATIFSGMDDMIVILIALVVLFGGTQLPKLARNTGEALREFRKSHSEAEAANQAVATAPAASPAAVVPAAVALPVGAMVSEPVQVVAAAPISTDTVTLTRDQLDALVAERAATTTVVSATAEGIQAES